MKNKFLSSLLCVFSFLFISSSTVFAANTSNVTGSSTSNNSTNKIIHKLSNKDYNKLKLQVSQFVKENQLKSNLPSTKDKTQNIKLQSFGGPAPKLTSLYVYGILSDQYGFEQRTSDSQLASRNSYANITGSEYVVTIEYGYGISGIAKMDTHQLTCAETDTINELGEINGKGTVIGFINFWDASTYRIGTFTYENTSENYPYNELSTFFNIK